MTEIIHQDYMDGYTDGRNPDTPEPSGNRSERYKHSCAAYQGGDMTTPIIKCPAGYAFGYVADMQDADFEVFIFDISATLVSETRGGARRRTERSRRHSQFHHQYKKSPP